MKIQHNSDLFSVRFQYTFDKDNRPRVTTCSILRLSNMEDRTGKLISKGVSLCNGGDQLRKAVGRKIALRRALAAGAFTRSQRTAFWTTYLAKAGV